MGLLQTVQRLNRRLLSTLTGYDAVRDKGQRKAASPVNRSEDSELTPFDRWKLYGAGRDIYRNFSIAAWAIRKHLDYVSTFAFHPKCRTPKHGELLRAKLHVWSRKENCDVAARHGLMRMLRLAESARTIDGDLLMVKIADGRLQAIEGDRLRTPPGGFPTEVGNPTLFQHGVQADEAGRAIQYAVCKRQRASDYSTAAGIFTFDRMVPAENAWLHGYFSRFDQHRGISPLSSAYNALRDVYEGIDYALLKLKVSQFLALAIFRDTDDPVGAVTVDPSPASELPETQTGAWPGDWPKTQDQFRIDFGRGPMQLDMDAADKVELLEAHTPSTESQAFLSAVIAVALKALDIPYSFYAENFTTFSGSRQAWIQYDQSAKSKRDDNRELLDAILNWRVGLWIEDGELPGTIEDYQWRWVAAGVPWIDPLKEVQADCQAVSAGFTSRTRVCRENGDDFFEIADEIAEENAYLESKGLPTAIQLTNVEIAEQVEAGAA